MPPHETAPVSFPRLGLSPVDAAVSVGVSRTRIFEAMRDGELAARKIGKSTVIEVDDLRAWLRNKPERPRGRPRKKPPP